MANKLIQKNEEIDWENITEADLGEQVHFEIAKDAFGDKELYCPDCKIKMQRKKINVPLINTPFTARIDSFVCSNCGKDLLNGTQAKKAEDLSLLFRATKTKSFGIRRSLNYDGKSVFIRLPIELKKYRNKKARIIPLQEKKFLIEIE
ncbi:MAG: hypothetical protein AABW45_01740 [Nanoarchaeota archaeon]|mgnify:CR=1 FL=1